MFDLEYPVGSVHDKELSGGNMFCPKCGNEAGEMQRFCKSCGANLQVVSDALGKGEDTLGQLRLDVDSLKRHAVDVARSFKAGIGGLAINGESEHARSRHKLEAIKEKRTPKPKEWLGYSWQHNLRDGLVSLFSGAGLGVFLYYMGRIAISEGAIRSIEELPNVHINGLEPLVRMIWLVALIPMLKGLAQIFYAAFFADSIANLSEKFLPKETVQQEPPPVNYIPLGDTPSSVTERTTQFFEDAPTPANRESQ